MKIANKTDSEVCYTPSWELKHTNKQGIPVGTYGFVIDSDYFTFDFLGKAVTCCKVCFPSCKTVHHILLEALEILP